jgi:WD40 repeat protein
VFSGDGDSPFFVTTSLDGSVRAWDTSSDQAKWKQQAGQRDLYSLSFRADDRIIVTAGLSNTLHFWDARSGEAREEYTLQLEDTDAPQGSRAAYSPVDADVLATARGNRAQLWRWQNGAGEWERQHTLTGHEDKILSLAFSPAGEWLVTSSADTTVRIWEVATGKLHLSISGHESGVTTAAFGPDGDRIIITEGQFTRTYPVLFEDIVVLAAQRKHRDLTAEERERYLLEMSGGEE